MCVCEREREREEERDRERQKVKQGDQETKLIGIVRQRKRMGPGRERLSTKAVYSRGEGKVIQGNISQEEKYFKNLVSKEHTVI